MDVEKQIRLCKQGNRKAQKRLYNFYAPLLYGLCRRYLRDSPDLDDVFINGMFKIFDNLDKFKGEGSFEGWLKRIMVNECLMHIRKNKKFQMVVEWSQVDKSEDPLIFGQLGEEEIKNLILELPQGYRTIFNMYVVEGYKHREIAEELGISINTSKSQLILAKKKLREMIKKKDLGNEYERYK